MMRVSIRTMAKTVLVVDDDPTQRRLTQGVLEREGFAVAHAESGEAAIDRLMAGEPADVILLDLTMPGLGGMATLKEMRQRGFATPVIVVTAAAGIDTVVQAMQAGAGDFFVKPVDPKYYATEAELARERMLRHDDHTAPGAQTAARGGFGLVGVLSWLAVGIPFLIGLYIVCTKVAAMF